MPVREQNNSRGYVMDLRVTTNAGTSGDVTMDIMQWSLPVDSMATAFTQVVFKNAATIFPNASTDHRQGQYRLTLERI